MDVGVDGSPSTRELKRRYYHFWEELGGHELVQGDLSRAEGVELGLSEGTKWWDCDKFQSMGRLKLLLMPEEEVNRGLPRSLSRYRAEGEGRVRLKKCHQ